MEYTFTYSGSGEGSDISPQSDAKTGLQSAEISRSALNSLDRIVILQGNLSDTDVFLGVYYNSKAQSMYITEVDASGIPLMEDAQCTVYDLFSPNVNLTEGIEYTLYLYYDSFQLRADQEKIEFVNKDAAENYFHMANMFQGEENVNAFLESIKAVDTGNVTTPPDGEDDATTAAEEDTTEAAEEAEETSDEVTEEDTTDATDEPASEVGNELVPVEPETETQADTEEESATTAEVEQPTDPPTPSNGNGGLIAGLVVLGLIAAGAIAGCVMLFNKGKKDAEEAQKALRAAQETEQAAGDKKVQELTAELAKKQEELNAERAKSQRLGEALEEVQAENKTLHENAESSSTQRQEEQLRLEEEKKQQDVLLLAEQGKKAELEKKLKALEDENKALKAQIEELSTVEPKENVDLLIATTEEKLNEYPQAIFLGLNISYTGVAELTNSDFNLGLLAVINGKAYPNPFLFDGLKDGHERYDNLEPLQHVFEMEGLENNGSRFGLVDITPAVIEKVNGAYTVVQKGTMRLTIG